MSYARWGDWFVSLLGQQCHSIRIRKVWDMVPPCVFWCIWWERNSRSFEGKERTLLEVKDTVLRTLMDWSKAAEIVSFSSVVDFLDFCIAWGAVFVVYTSCVPFYYLLNKTTYLLIKKRKEKDPAKSLMIWPNIQNKSLNVAYAGKHGHGKLGCHYQSVLEMCPSPCFLSRLCNWIS